MKRFFMSCLLTFAVIAGFAQQPAVNISVNGVTQTTFTCAFVKNEFCDSYVILSAAVGEMDQWLPMMGSLENAVDQWGVSFAEDASYTWTDQVPGTQYVVYALAKGATQILCTDTLFTPSGGGSGASVIELSVTNIGDTSATTTATPNDQTLLFKDMTITREVVEEIGTDSLRLFLQLDLFTYYETDVWTWFSLTPATDYYFTAIGMNADSVWGELAMFPFTTTGENGIAWNNLPDFQVYPNPVTDKVTIRGLVPNSKIVLFDAQGIMIQSVMTDDAQCELQMKQLPAGIYFIAVQTAAATTPSLKKIIKQ